MVVMEAFGAHYWRGKFVLADCAGPFIDFFFLVDFVVAFFAILFFF